MDQKAAHTAKTILIADGDVHRLERIQKILTDAGYRVLTASSAEQAEALADTPATFDLIICSVVMDGASTGVHLAEHIERSKRTNSTLLVSRYSRELLRNIPGFDQQRDFLSTTPFDSEELLGRVHVLLSRPRLKPTGCDVVTSPDSEERRVLAEYETATQFYAWAVSELSRQRPTASYDDYQELLKVARDAHTECEKTRIALRDFRPS